TGIANKTFRVSIKNTKVLNNNDVEHNDVIVRIYNSGLFKGESKLKFNGESAEVLVMQILSRSGLAPKLLGVFAGGRIEEYIPSSVASVDELTSVELGKAVIRKVAHYHTQIMPISKQPNLIEKLIDVVNNTNITGQVPD
ncbi:Choline kinase alpha-like protein, partial [Leptotrombidium deliense]